MNKKALSKEISEKELKLIQLKEELYDLKDRYEEEFEAKEIEEKYIGRYFMYKDNSYSCPEEVEGLYRK